MRQEIWLELVGFISFSSECKNERIKLGLYLPKLSQKIKVATIFKIQPFACLGHVLFVATASKCSQYVAEMSQWSVPELYSVKYFPSRCLHALFAVLYNKYTKIKVATIGKQKRLLSDFYFCYFLLLIELRRLYFRKLKMFYTCSKILPVFFSRASL